MGHGQHLDQGKQRTTGHHQQEEAKRAVEQDPPHDIGLRRISKTPRIISRRPSLLVVGDENQQQSSDTGEPPSEEMENPLILLIQADFVLLETDIIQENQGLHEPPAGSD